MGQWVTQVSAVDPVWDNSISHNKAENHAATCIHDVLKGFIHVATYSSISIIHFNTMH